MAETGKKKQKPRVSEKIWAQIRAEYEGSDTTTLTILAKKYRTHTSTISIRASREGWVRPKARKEAYEEANKAAMEKAVAKSVDYTAQYFEETLEDYARSRAILKRQLQVFEVTSYADATKMTDALKKAKPFLESGETEKAEEILADCKIDKNAPYKFRAVIENLVSLDTARRRLLGLDKGVTPESVREDPMQQWMDDISEARMEYQKQAAALSKAG